MKKMSTLCLNFVLKWIKETLTVKPSKLQPPIEITVLEKRK